jgi:hypothetical protein
MRNALYLGPVPFTAVHLLSFSSRGEDTPRRNFFAFFRGRRRSPPPYEDGAESECPAAAGPQMGCFAHHLAAGGFDTIIGPQSPCERSCVRCIDRLR